MRPATFAIGSGVFGLTGPHGPGRFALFATLATLRRPTVGELELLGHDATARAGRRAARARLGLLPARFDGAGVKVRDFVSYAAYYKCTDRGTVDAIIERFGLTDAAESELGMLPRDLRLKAGLAATCVHRPDLVLLDEPLAGVGESERGELIPMLRGLAPVVLVTAADPAELAGWCDQELRVVRGRLVEPPSGSPPRARVPAGV